VSLSARLGASEGQNLPAADGGVEAASGIDLAGRAGQCQRSGTYDKLKLDVHAVELAPSAAFDDLVRRGASVLVEGTVDGQPFTFATRLEAELEHEGSFELGGAAANITLNIDASQWFRAADGSRLNPLDAGARDAIVANIRASFSAFEDDDEDGADDRGHHDGGDDHGEHDGGDDHGEHDGGSDDGSGHH
jgi:hypothetical protein